MEYGPYNGDEGLNDFTHGFVMTFDTRNRVAFSPPILSRVKAFVVPNLERVIVFDTRYSFQTKYLIVTGND